MDEGSIYKSPDKIQEIDINYVGIKSPDNSRINDVGIEPPDEFREIKVNDAGIQSPDKIREIDVNDVGVQSSGKIREIDVNDVGVQSSGKIREIEVNNVGIDSLPSQMVKTYVLEGFVFNILLIGETGIGKSTLISSLFNIQLDSFAKSHSSTEIKLISKKFDISEGGVNLRLTVTETVGYGDQINRNDDVAPIVSHIKAQFESYLNEELRIKRDLSHLRDSRIHTCLYFIAPTGHRLKSIDLFCMKQLQGLVNIIPVIAKSDSLTKTELQNFKMNIKIELEKENIKIYQFPIDDEEMSEINKEMNKRMPLAVTASEEFKCNGNKLVRCREFPWGRMLVDDEQHSEFLALKDMLIVTNMEDLKEKTHYEHYERYRNRRLIQVGFSEFSFEDLGRKRKELYDCMLEEEDRLRQKFVDKVRNMENQLRRQEIEIQRKYEEEYIILENEMKKLLEEKYYLELQISKFQSEKFEAEKKSSKYYHGDFVS